MLNDLKRYINRDNEFTSALEAAAYAVIENSTDDIKSAFLDDPNARMVGVENDPEIKKLVDSIPPVDGDVSNIDVSKMIEDYIPDEDGDGVLESFDDDSVLESFEDDDITIESFEDDDDVLEADIEDVYYDGEYLAEDIDFDSTFDPEVDDVDMNDRDDLADARDNITYPDRISENSIIDDFDMFDDE